jgi:hypothetical protein
MLKQVVVTGIIVAFVIGLSCFAWKAITFPDMSGESCLRLLGRGLCSQQRLLNSILNFIKTIPLSRENLIAGVVSVFLRILFFKRQANKWKHALNKLLIRAFG